MVQRRDYERSRICRNWVEAFVVARSSVSVGRIQCTGADDDHFDESIGGDGRREAFTSRTPDSIPEFHSQSSLPRQ